MTISVVEHTVLFKVKEGTTSDQLSAMASGLRSLASLHGIIAMHFGEVEKPEPGGWTHALYTRYKDKEALEAYQVSPEHVAVISINKPLLAEVAALDWEAQVPEPSPGKTERVHVLWIKAKERKDNQLKAIAATVRDQGKGLPSVEEVTMGYNFNMGNGRSKGFDWGMVSIHASEEALHEGIPHVLRLGGMSDAAGDLADEYMSLGFNPSVPVVSKI